MSGDAPSRRGLFGGTFNPPHVGHLIVAHVVAEELDLEDVLLVPSYRHAFKGEVEATPRDRLTMVELAVAGDDRLGVERAEIDRGGTSYTVETLETLRSREPGTEWSLILGWDNLADLGAWHRAEALPKLAEIVVTTREESGGAEPPELPFPGRCTTVVVPALEVSSSAIRSRVRAGLSIRYWVTPGVEAFIRRRELYLEDSPDR